MNVSVKRLFKCFLTAQNLKLFEKNNNIFKQHVWIILWFFKVNRLVPS